MGLIQWGGRELYVGTYAIYMLFWQNAHHHHPPGSYSTRVLYDFDKRHHPQHIFWIIVPWVPVGTICFHERTPPPSIFCIIVPWVPVGTICFHERTPPAPLFFVLLL